MFITRKHLSRRAMLRGSGAALALPLLDAMLPACTALAASAARPRSRFVSIYIPHGATLARWTPASDGKNFEFSPILKPLEPWRDYVNVLSNLAHAPVGPLAGEDAGGAENHNRAIAAFLTGAHPVKGERAYVGASVDQVAAQAIGQDTPLPSIELSVEPAGLNCGSGFNCAYNNTLAWKSATLPLPMENNPQTVFENLFGDGSTAETRNKRRELSGSLLDSLLEEVDRLNKNLSLADRSSFDDYLQEVREIERRTALVDAKLSQNLELPDAPAGIAPDFATRLELLFDLQVLAFKTDMTRISTLMLARELSNAVYAASGVTEGFHTCSHHSHLEENKLKFAAINQYHITQLAKFADKLAQTPDGEHSLLDNTVVLYGSGLSDGNEHSFDPLPVLLLGKAAGRLEGDRHLRFPPQTPMSNLLLSLLHVLDVPRDSIGDSTDTLAI
ncbi:MAG: DUF1552 domain-containing protein [Pseudomonadales bacterium]|jgi:hypothetical protein|nr:DUF1552 domain-containing protein [Pseudomonadales bacterium]